MIFKNQKGFSLLEIIVAAGLLGVLSLGLMSMMKNMQKGQVVSETKMEELELRRLITTLLTDQIACQNTLVNTNIGASITQIKNNANAIAFQTNNTYGNNSIKITAMSTQDLGIVNADGTRTINLNLSLKKMKQLSGGGTKTASIQMNVVAPSASGTITKCFVDSDQIVSTANQTSCVSLGGTWNIATGTCSLGNYVKKSGDTMTGVLNANVTGNLTGNVTGNLTGNVTGNLTGNVAGNLTGNVAGNLIGNVTGNVTGTTFQGGTFSGTSFTYTSDARLKTNIREIPNALDRILNLHGVMYEWKDQKNSSKVDQIGVIAQEVEKIFPEAVVTNRNTGMKSVEYGNLIAPMIEALKKQQAIILKQQQEIEDIKKILSQKGK